MKFRELLLLWWRRRRLARWRRRSRRTGGPPRRMRLGAALTGVPLSPLALAGGLPDKGPALALQPTAPLSAACGLRFLAGGGCSDLRDPDPAVRITPQLSHSHTHVIEHGQGCQQHHPQALVFTEGCNVLREDHVLCDEGLPGYSPHHDLQVVL